MNAYLRAALTALAFAMTATSAIALSIGDPPPALQVDQWLKGEPVESLAPDQTYVIFFWATWGGDPCVRQYPVLAELVRQHPDVVFIGINADDPSNEQKVARYIEIMGDQMEFRIARDTPDAFMRQNWMKAAAEEGIPSSFIVHQNQLAWIGHPDGLSEMLPFILSDDFTIDVAKQHEALFARIRAFQQKARAGATDAELEAEGKELEALHQQYRLCFTNETSWTFNAQQYVQWTRHRAALENYRAALDADADEATLAAFEAAVRAANPEDLDPSEDIRFEQEKADRAKKGREFQALEDAYFSAVREPGEPGRAADLAARIEALDTPDPHDLNCLAWKILTELDPSQRDCPFALRLAQSAVDATDGKSAAILDTYARALFDSGRVTEAIEWQQKAIDACEHEWDKPEYAQRLAEFQAAAAKDVTPAP